MWLTKMFKIAYGMHATLSLGSTMLQHSPASCTVDIGVYVISEAGVIMEIAYAF